MMITVGSEYRGYAKADENPWGLEIGSLVRFTATNSVYVVRDISDFRNGRTLIQFNTTDGADGGFIVLSAVRGLDSNHRVTTLWTLEDRGLELVLPSLDERHTVTTLLQLLNRADVPESIALTNPEWRRLTDALSGEGDGQYIREATRELKYQIFSFHDGSSVQLNAEFIPDHSDYRLARTAGHWSYTAHFQRADANKVTVTPNRNGLTVKF